MTASPATPAGPTRLAGPAWRGSGAFADISPPPCRLIGLLVVIAYALIGLLAPWLAPLARRTSSAIPTSPGAASFLFGTDQLGRDVLSRLIYGARNTIGIAFITTCLSFFVGVMLGLLTAVVGGWADQLLARLVDVLMAIPQLVFTLVLVSIFGSSVINLILIIAMLDATRVFRLSRAVATNVVAMEFIEAARLQGQSLLWIMTREVLPNIMPPLVAEFGLRFCFVFLTISALSFLGLGIQPPSADWGAMVRENATLITYGDITPLLPAGAIGLLTVAVNFVVDWFLHKSSGLRDGR